MGTSLLSPSLGTPVSLTFESEFLVVSCLKLTFIKPFLYFTPEMSCHSALVLPLPLLGFPLDAGGDWWLCAASACLLASVLGPGPGPLVSLV